jgi:hypothetical protein
MGMRTITHAVGVIGLVMAAHIVHRRAALLQLL